MNPYAEEQHDIKTISMFHAYTPKVWDRGAYLKYFSEKLNLSIVRVAVKLKGMQDLRTLAYIKSSCDDYERMGNPWSKGFNGMLRCPQTEQTPG